MDPFVPLLLRYMVGRIPGCRPEKKAGLRSAWKRYAYILMELVSEPKVVIHMCVKDEKPISPDQGAGWLHFYKFFSRRRSGFPLIGNKEFGVAMLAVPENIADYLRSISGKSSAAYHARKAERRGYIVKQIDPNQYLEDIHELKISKPERQGKSIPDMYRKKMKNYEVIPNYYYWGVVNRENKLVGCLWLASCNEVMIVDVLLGHGDYQKDGIMYQLVVHIVKYAAEMKRTGHPVKYVMYDTMMGATDGMIMFKRKLGFKPYRVKWMP